MGQNILLSHLYGEQCAGYQRAADLSTGTCLSAQGGDVDALIPLEEARKRGKWRGIEKPSLNSNFKRNNVKGQILILVALFADIGATSDKGMRLEFRQKCDSCVSEKGLYERNGQILTC